MKTNEYKNFSTTGNRVAYALGVGYLSYSQMPAWNKLAFSFSQYGWRDGGRYRRFMCLFPPYKDASKLFLAGTDIYRLGVSNYAPLMEVWADPVKYGVTYRDVETLVKRTEKTIYELFEDYIDCIRPDTTEEKRVHHIDNHWYYYMWDTKLVCNVLEAKGINILLTETSMRAIIKNRLEIDALVKELDDAEKYGYEWKIPDPEHSIYDKKYRIGTNGCWIERDNTIIITYKYDLTPELLKLIEENHKPKEVIDDSNLWF